MSSTTIANQINQIYTNIQLVFEQLMKLVIAKTITPVLGKCPNGESVNIYTYSMVHACLGWTCDNITSFRIKNKTGNNISCGNQNKTIPAQIAYSRTEKQNAIQSGRIPTATQYKNIVKYITARNTLTIVSNGKVSAMGYYCDVTYSDIFSQLNSIGQDIIRETDPKISPNDSAMMSTAQLRRYLFELEQALAILSKNAVIYDSYIEMVQLINSVDNSQITYVIDLIALLSFEPWDCLPKSKRYAFARCLGNDFLETFNSNILIGILLQSDSAELILTSSYIYSLLKMLFVVFGYNKLTPELASSIGCVVRSACDGSTPNRYSQVCPKKGDLALIEIFRDMYPLLNYFIVERIINLQSIAKSVYDNCNGCRPCEKRIIKCCDIPQNYDDLDKIQAYFWRYFDYAYCQYISNQQLKRYTSALSTRVSNKTKYLKSL